MDAERKKRGKWKTGESGNPKDQSLSCVGFPIPPGWVIRHDFGAAARIRRLQTTAQLIPVTAGGLQV